MLSELCTGLDKRFAQELLEDPTFGEAVHILRQNSQGNLWLIGGGVFRKLASLLYDTPLLQADYDFIVESPVKRFSLPAGWRVTANRHGNPKFCHGVRSIDYVPLSNIHSIKERGLIPNIEHYLSGVPLTVQSIAYDIEKGALIGAIGLAALDTRTVEVHNASEAVYAAGKKGLTLTQ